LLDLRWLLQTLAFVGSRANLCLKDHHRGRSDVSNRNLIRLPFCRPAVLLASWFGTGLLPLAPGTWGSLAALPCAWAIRAVWGPGGLAAAAAIAFIAGCWAAARLAKASAVADPGLIVIDEVAGQWVTLLPAPLNPLAYALAFVLFRIFDIWKPWPVRWADRHVHGGLGIMLDDLLAAIYAALTLLVLLAIAGAFGVRS
jgi:phosphatidylglycerophosphatase A